MTDRALERLGEAGRAAAAIAARPLPAHPTFLGRTLEREFARAMAAGDLAWAASVERIRDAAGVPRNDGKRAP